MNNKPWLIICPVCGATNTHHPYCPEATHLEPVCKCSECGEGMYNGEPYYQINEHIICEECINSFRHILDIDEYTYTDYLSDKYERERHDV